VSRSWNCQLGNGCNCSTPSQSALCSGRTSAISTPVGHTPRVGEERPTLRDQFAMAALTGFMVRMDLENYSAPYAAGVAYKFANAMMKERPLPAPPVEVKG